MSNEEVKTTETNGTRMDTPIALLNTANRIVARVIDAFARHDEDALVALMTPDVEVTHSLSPTPLIGADRVRRFYRTAVFGPMPDVTIRPVDGPFPHPSAPRFAISWVTVGTAVVPTPDGERRRTIEVAVREVAELEGDLVRRLSIVVDHASLVRQLEAAA